ncbi:hydrogenase iron-sulfur subunit [Desulfosporosinus hippei]|uniref:Quinone-modifying oxidoreductase subunit QmoB n=1 Tax=Desulfosporosinus hippei DSM 8344 TaxID=1121419 RepID=A0A1G8EJE3_9FIRM|nr:hydrogenase iron-sulfur subunit [Desulfosporosinus hippei]SDH69988.1 quinone-modifying oxidoreductase subunit QmoB [Desulfosporosinus hippei DSM 8344]
MVKKTGVYICTGCSLGESLEIESLSKVATKEGKVPVCKTHPFLCGSEGVELIKSDIENEGVNTILIAACSPRVNYDVFEFDSVIMERVNLREQVIWSQTANDEDTQMMAEDYLRMGLAKVKHIELPEPYQGVNMVKTLLVVGGGLTGMTSALEAAKAGYKAVLVEKSSALGGWMNGLFKQVPRKAPYTAPEEVDVAELIKEVEANPDVTVYTGAEILEIAGSPGMFDASISQNGATITERVGSVVLATGAVPYDPTKLDYLGYGKYENVITGLQMEEIASKGKIVRPDGKEVQTIAFIQCAGSRDPEHLPYCSATCCVESLKQASYIKEQNPEANVFVFYKDMRTPGQYERLYQQVQKDGSIFVRGEIKGITEDGEKNLLIEATDVLSGATISTEAVDMVVLANGMVPTTALGEDFAAKADTEEDKKDDGPKPEVILRSNLLNLSYRQGPEMPTLKYGFADSHFICFPYETRRTGIYAAGSVRAPMDELSSIEDATGATLKAIQCMESSAQGMAVHPRVGDMSFPDFAMSRCTQCKRCTVECPFGAINEDDKFNPLPNPTRCRRCGICMGACPERIITFKNYSVPMIGNLIKSIEVPDEDEEKPRILIFACENDAYPALDMAGINRLKYNAWVRVIPLRCLGSLSLVWIADSMSAGIDGIYLLGCKHGDDYQCHFIKGSELAEIRLSKVSETLDRLDLDSERVRMDQISITDYDKIPAMLDDFAAKLEELGPNPYKGF